MNKVIVAIESAQNFYELINMHFMELKSKNDILENFYIHFHSAVHGCSCKKNYNLEEANRIYEYDLKDLEMPLKEQMKNILNANQLLFFKDKKAFLFQF